MRSYGQGQELYQVKTNVLIRSEKEPGSLYACPEYKLDFNETDVFESTTVTKSGLKCGACTTKDTG